MAKVSISQAWDETRAVLARDGKLMAPVALAFLVLPGIVVNVLVPSPSNLVPNNALVPLVAIIVAFLITFAGQLSIVRLAMGPHITVGEAIGHGARRTLPFVGAFLIWIVPFVILCSVPFELIRLNPAQPPPLASLALIVVSLIGIFVAVRLLLIAPVASAESGGPIAVVRRSWGLTAGNWWRLFGFLLLFIVGAAALLWAAASVVGLIARLALGPVSALSPAGLIIIIVGQVLTVAMYVVLFVMQTRIYLQLAGRAGTAAGVPNTGI